MATRWYTTFTDRMGRACRVNIGDTVYTGTAIEVEAGPVPIAISWLAQGDNKYTPGIKASEAKVTLLTTTSLQYLDVFAYANKRFSCSLIIDETVIWAGWASPEYYREPFIHTPYLTTLTFTDGLVELKNKEFSPPRWYTTPEYKKSLIFYIAGALQQIGLQLPIYTAIDLAYSTIGTGDVSERVLENALIDMRTFRNDDLTYWTYYDVLNEILKSLLARMYLCDGAWVIENIDQKSSTYRVERYLYNGTYSDSVAAQDDTVQLTAWSSGNVLRFVNTPAELEVAPAAKKFTVEQDYGKLQNILNTGNFTGDFPDSEWVSGNTARYWGEYGNATIARVESENALQIDALSPATAGDFIFSDEIDLTDFKVTAHTLMNAWAKGEVKMKVQYYAKLNVTGDLGTITNCVLASQIVLNCSGTEYFIAYAPDAATPIDLYWTTVNVDGWTYFNLVNRKLTDWNLLEVDIPTPPSAEYGNTHTSLDFALNLFPYTISASGSVGYGAGDGLMIKGVRVYFEKMTERDRNDLQEVDDTKTRETTYDIDDDNLLEPDVYSVKFGTTPEGYDDEYGHALINKYVIFDTVGYPINYWKRLNTSRLGDLIFLINREDLQLTYRQAMIRLRGMILDETNALSFRSVLKDYDSRYYIPIALTWDVQQCMWDGEWLHFYPSTMQGDFNSDFGEDFFID